MGLFRDVNRNLAKELYRAATLCGQSSEEEGGLILQNGADFEFVKIKNIYTGSNTALGLYETDTDEFTTLIHPRLVEGSKLFASFHTHPSFSPNPSTIDTSNLFKGFKHNFIYASGKSLFSCSVWLPDQEDFYIYYFPMSSLKKIAENEA